MKTVALIPARYDSKRFPGKLLKKIGKESVILHTYKAAVNSKLFDDVFVVTDSKDIYKEINSNNGKVILKEKSYSSGTDRIADIAKDINADIFINIQGDEPFIIRNQLLSLIREFDKDKEQKIDIASLMIRITDLEEFNNPNNVKVVCDKNNFAMYFSRAGIPSPRDLEFDFAYKHIGVYAFRKNILMKIIKLEKSELEKIEKLENLRFLENGFKIKMIETNHSNFGIDTPEDLKKAIEFINKNNNDL